MAHGVEVRVPLLDQDLVALAARFPDGMKQRGRTGTWVFKKAMEPYLFGKNGKSLPRHVLSRGGRDF